ncbi:hypothetical protein O9K51_02281 [Purpureocillium lavendulum]|uniref:Uncharacterized protein n=1 Tax=Purpureocillium lavendulum TaxID=1247861 RepID=A0AB34FX13_9HYPO|nr:hypothetical protein O9K51_02281 [Purpureocillium lavendulum]
MGKVDQAGPCSWSEHGTQSSETWPKPARSLPASALWKLKTTTAGSTKQSPRLLLHGRLIGNEDAAGSVL